MKSVIVINIKHHNPMRFVVPYCVLISKICVSDPLRGVTVDSRPFVKRKNGSTGPIDSGPSFSLSSLRDIESLPDSSWELNEGFSSFDFKVFVYSVFDYSLMNS
jgi:hypothetical protein